MPPGKQVPSPPNFTPVSSCPLHLLWGRGQGQGHPCRCTGRPARCCPLLLRMSGKPCRAPCPPSPYFGAVLGFAGLISRVRQSRLPSVEEPGRAGRRGGGGRDALPPAKCQPRPAAGPPAGPARSGAGRSGAGRSGQGWPGGTASGGSRGAAHRPGAARCPGGHPRGSRRRSAAVPSPAAAWETRPPHAGSHLFVPSPGCSRPSVYPDPHPALVTLLLTPSPPSPSCSLTQSSSFTTLPLPSTDKAVQQSWSCSRCFSCTQTALGPRGARRAGFLKHNALGWEMGMGAACQPSSA